MLVYWIPDTPSTIPANASHRVCVGAIVLNDKREVFTISATTSLADSTYPNSTFIFSLYLLFLILFLVLSNSQHHSPPPKVELYIYVTVLNSQNPFIGTCGPGKEWHISRKRRVENPYWSCWWGTCLELGIFIVEHLMDLLNHLNKIFNMQGEEIFMAAIREVKEETAVSN